MICINCNTVWTVCSSVSRWPYPFIYCLLHSMYWCILSLSLVCACGIASTYIPHSTFDTIIARRLVTIVGDNWQVGHIINCPPMSTKFLHICSLCYFVLSRFPFFIAMFVRLVQVASNYESRPPMPVIHIYPPFDSRWSPFHLSTTDFS